MLFAHDLNIRRSRSRCEKLSGTLFKYQVGDLFKFLDSGWE